MRDAAFVDTSAFVALRNEREREHAAARRARAFVERRVPLLTSSYVDATSFALMARERITVAFSFDRDFAHRGLAPVPASPR